MILPSTGFLRTISVISRFRFFENLSSRLEVNEFRSSRTETSEMATGGSNDSLDFGNFGFFVEKSTGSF